MGGAGVYFDVYVDVEKVAESAGKLPGVALAKGAASRGLLGAVTREVIFFQNGGLCCDTSLVLQPYSCD